MDDDFTPPDLARFPPQTVVADRYEVLEHIGHGSMGLVLKARDRVLDDEIVVLKILYTDLVKDSSLFARFRREVLLTRKLSHPHIVRIYDFGDAGKGNCFISMEYVEGQSLEQNLRNSLNPQTKKKGLPIPTAAGYLHQVALALAYAHSQGVVHRDIKPGNILVTKDSQIKITDFGVARSLDSEEKLTKTDEAVGTPIYMSPEQLVSGKLDHRSDIYALGIMAYELVMGVPPFFSENWMDLVKMHLQKPIPEFAGKESGIPYWYQELVNKACTKKPEARMQSASDFAKFIEDNMELGEKSSNEASIPKSKTTKSKILLIGAAVGLLSVLLAAGIFFLTS